jgi:7,8-dihydropterin-6-yl-methyl-4-(beta-D-ribofuranosyl)aminobenzene 5'-phosphate synthase
MSKTICVTTLVENSVTERELMAEHGLSFFIQAGSFRLLFDTGQSDLVSQNALTLNISLQNLDAVVLSHGHYDHTGGLSAVGGVAPEAKIFYHPAALASKFTRSSDGKSRSIGMTPPNLGTVLEQKRATVETRQVTEIVEGIYVTGEIPRETSFENTGGKFYLDEAGALPDPLLDDQALFFDTRDGLVILLGCAHSGVVNTLNYVRRITGCRSIHTIIGGLHLLTASEDRIQKTIESFRQWNMQRIAPCHCTGMLAMTQLWSAFPGRCAHCSVGTSMMFQA